MTTAAPARVTVADHALVQDKLARLRSKETGRAAFRSLLRELGRLLGYPVTHDLPLEDVAVETPLRRTRAARVPEGKLVLVPILRAGNGLLGGLLDLAPDARVGLIGLRRDPATLEAREYYFKMPPGLSESRVLVLDPMLASGHSAVAAVARLKAAGARDLRLVAVVAAPEGLRALDEAHPDVPVHLAAVDEGLDEHGHILPGIGDAGDRLYGTPPEPGAT